MPSDYPLDAERSRELAVAILAQNKQCWSNTFRAMTYPRGVGLAEGLEYVEGWVVANDLPIVMEHAWLVDPEAGVIIDPTPVYHAEGRGHTYFPAVSYTRLGLARVAVNVGQQPFALRDEPDAWHAAYLAAQVWAVGKDGALLLHDHHIGERERQWVEEANERPTQEAEHART